MITDEDLRDLPLGTEAAFVKLVDLLNARLDDVSGDRFSQLAQKYIDVLLAFIDEREMGIELDRRPPSDDNGWFDWFQRFRSVINYHQHRFRFRHFTSPIDAQISAVALNNAHRAEIHKLTNKIRKVVANLKIDERKRDAIYRKIAALDSEVDKSKTGLGTLLDAYLEISSVAVKGGEPLIKLMTRAANIFYGASHQQKTLPRPDAKRLPPPVKPAPTKPARPLVQDLDDEIPF